MAPGRGWNRKWMNRCREGQALSEYAMVLLFIAIACVAAATLLGGPIRGFYTGFNGSF
jgi:Flp pilus assembly pilin Flp